MSFFTIIITILLMSLILRILDFSKDFIVLYVSNSILGLICLYILIYLKILHSVSDFYLLIVSLFGLYGTIVIGVLEIIFKL